MDAAVGMLHDEREAEVRDEAAQNAEARIVDILTDKEVGEELPLVLMRQPAVRASETANGAVASTSGKAGQSGKNGKEVATATAPKITAATIAANRRKRARVHKTIAERMARKELEDQIIEIELEPEDNASSVFEFVAGLPGEDFGDSFQELLNTLPNSRRRSRRVPVKEARQLLTHEEANHLIDFEAVVEQATQRTQQSGVVFLDEIDKIVGSKVDIGPDVAGEGVQRDLLPLVEGSTVMTRYGPIKTDHVLWIAAGAFHNAKPSDLIPELQGRLPLRVELAPLDEDDYRRILTQPENALTRQYEALLGVERVTLEFTPDGLDEVARCAQRMNDRVENIGASRLHTIMEKLLEEVSFDAPDLAGQTITVDAAFVRGRLEKLLADEDLSRYIL